LLTDDDVATLNDRAGECMGTSNAFRALASDLTYPEHGVIWQLTPATCWRN
jgi:hypothetical protein